MKRFTIGLLAVVLATGIVPAGAGQAQDAERLLKAAVNTEMVDGNLNAAIEQYKKVAQSSNRVLAAQALVRMADCYQKLGDAQARTVYEQLVRDYADQREPVATARGRLAAMRPAGALSASKTTRQIWSGPGVDGGGSPSPDGRYLSFTDWETGDLAVRDLRAGSNRRLTNRGGWVASGDYASESVISPDGRQVAYAWFVAKDFKNELRVIPIAPIAGGAPGAARTVVRTDRNDYLRPVAWAPDGRIVYVVRSLPDRTNQIGTVSMQDGSFRSLKSLDWRYPDRVSLSPDGRFLAYDVPAGDNGSPRDISLLATDGSSETPLARGPKNDASPLWSADGAHVLFLSDRTGTTALWSIAVGARGSTDAAVMVKGDVGAIQPLGITRDGTLLYSVPGRSRQNVYTAELDEVGSARPPALATEQFVNSNSGPAWSPDGQYLAYYSYRNSFGSAPVLVVRSERTGDERTVTLPAGVAAPFFSGPKWFPDNRFVLVLSRDAQGSGFGFYRLALDTGTTDLLWRINRGTSSFALSPDGKSIFCAFQNSGDQKTLNPSGRLMRFDIDNKRETELKKDEWFITLAVSPDGTQLAYLKSVRNNTTESPSVVEVMPAAGGPSREVYREAIWFDGSRYNALTWTPDQRFLLFVRGDEATEGILWRVPLSGGRPEKVGISSAGRIKSPTVHASGRKLAFRTSETDDNEIWTLENFLPAQAAKR